MTYLSLLLISPLASAIVNVSDVRGTEIKQFSSPNGLTEICVVPAHLTGVTYSNSDLKREQKLCAFDFYAATSVLCPKYQSTSASVIPYTADSPTGKKDLQNASKCQALNNDKITTPKMDKLAKFKQNEPLNDTTGTVIQSPLAYYHISRALGNILNVPVAVIRTMDYKPHLEVAKIFTDLSSMAKVSPGTKKGWDSFRSMHSGKRDNFKLYTGDQQQIFGALIKGGGTTTAYDIETQALLNTMGFYQVHISSSSILDLLKNVPEATKRERTFLAIDMADMVVIDAILEQSDRYSGSNIESFNTYWNGQKYLSQKDADELSAADKKTLKKIRRLSIQDNDAGMNTPKNIDNLKRIDRMKHISPATYKNVLALAQIADLKTFLMTETLMSEAQATRVVATVQKLSQKFQQDCKSGKLLVDLDIDAVMNNTANLDFSKSQCQ